MIHSPSNDIIALIKGGFTKNELIGFTEFLSNTGGLLGLFMGFSVISLIEIVYFLTLRPYCTLKRSEVQPSADVTFPSKLFNNNGARGANSKPSFVGQPASNDYYMRSDQCKQKSLCQEVYSQFVTMLRHIKAKLMSAWNGLVEWFREETDEGQAPYPFYN